MDHVHHFTYGPVTGVLAYLAAFAGSLLGLLCARRARAVVSRRPRALWLSLAAVALGGGGIWVMHFIAMLGFGVQGVELRYDIELTLLSAVLAVVMVGAGLFIVGFGDRRVINLLAGGAVTGGGVAAMHYVGMYALSATAHYHYAPALVALSVVIALVAATAALWFSLWVDGAWATTGAALIMGVATTGMHYTGMLALQVHAHKDMENMPIEGVPVSQVLPVFVIGIALVSAVLFGVIMLSPSDEEMRTAVALRDRMRAREAG